MSAIEHTVVFTLRHESGSEEESAFLADGEAALTSIPGVTQFAVRRQVSPKSTFAHQFTMVFADQAAYDAYNVHPVHVDFVQSRWIPEVAEFQEYDFEA